MSPARLDLRVVQAVIWPVVLGSLEREDNRLKRRSAEKASCFTRLALKVKRPAHSQSEMKLKPLYTIRFSYPDGWEVKLKDSDDPNSQITEEQHFYFAEGSCEGSISGEFHGANHPHRRVDKNFEMNLQGFIRTDDGALIMTDYRGYGRSAVITSQKYRFRQVVGSAWHVTDSERYRWLNDCVCAIAGEVRRPADVPPEQIKQADVRLVFDVAELVWEPVAN